MIDEIFEIVFIHKNVLEELGLLDFLWLLGFDFCLLNIFLNAFMNGGFYVIIMLIFIVFWVFFRGTLVEKINNDYY